MNSVVLIEPIAELEQLTALCTEQERLEAERLGTAHRKAEYLAWRALLRRELGRNIRIGYDEWGGPIVEGSDWHIGVSHSKRMVAVIISHRPCAIDIEDVSRNFERVASRYLTDDERRLCSHPELAAVAWCAKETLYKYYRRGGVDFLSDVRLTAVDIPRGEIRGHILGGEELTMRLRSEGDYRIVTLGE